MPKVGRLFFSSAVFHADTRLKRPKAVSAAPVMIRPFDAPVRSIATSRSAARGGTLVARQAGTIALSTVMSSPARSAKATVDELITRLVVGRSTPPPLKIPRDADGEQDADQQTEHRGDEADDHRLEQHRPEHLALARTDGPKQRQLAGALGHEDGEGVGDDERADEQGDSCEEAECGAEEPEALLHVEAPCSAASTPVITSRSLPTTGRMRSTSSSWEIPSSAAAMMVSTCPTTPASRWASGRVKLAETAPPRASSLPKVSVPTSTYWRAPSCVSTVTVSPTEKSPSSVAATSSAISLSAVGRMLPSATS